MRPFIPVLLACALAPAAFGAQTNYERIPLKKESVAHLLKALPQYNLAKDLRILSIEKDNALIVQGSPQAIRELKQVIEARERFAIRQVKLAMQVIRVRFDADGTWDAETVASPTVLTLLTDKATLSTDARDADNNAAQSQSIELTPTFEFLDKKNPNGFLVIALKGIFSVQDAAQNFNASVRVQGKPLPGKKLIVGLTDSKDPLVRALVEKGQFPQAVETPTTVYYLHVTPTFVPDKN